MIRGDRDITTQIMAELRWDPGVNADHVAVLSSFGTVVLTGSVESYCDWWTAGWTASQVPGVRTVENRIEVKLPPSSVRSDDKILADCTRALNESALGAVEPVRVRAEHGWVTLEGRVDVAFLAARAERAVRGVVGIRGVTNHIAAGRAPAPHRPAARVMDGYGPPRHPPRRSESRPSWDRRPPRP